MNYKLFGSPKRYIASPSLQTSLRSSASQTVAAKGNDADFEVLESIRFTVPEAIAIYLACHDKAIEREELADLFFEKATVAKTRHNLRSNLNKLRKNTEDIGLSDFIQTNGGKIDFLVECDVVDFEKAFDENRYQDVIECYQGEFLEGFLGLRTAPEFNAWVDQKRFEFKDKYFVATRDLAHSLATDDKALQALELLNTAIQKNVLDEKATELCEQLLELALQHGQPLKGLNYYNDYKRMLKVGLEQLDIFELDLPAGLELLVQELQEQQKQSRIASRVVVGADVKTSNNALSKTSYIPPQATTFIGRDNEISELLGELLDANTRMISLIGYGGIGKTRLAVQLATSTQDYYADGVFVVELVAVQAIENIPSAINTVLGIKSEVGESPEDALNRVLKDKQLLLVLDNFEHLLTGSEIVERLLEQHHTLDVIVTSRELLGLAWEHHYPIKGLKYPELEEEQSLEDIADFEDYDAVKLFLRTAKARARNFTLEGKKPAIQQICSYVEGLPLGIELAASWVASHSCEMIAETLQKDVSGIKTRLKDVPDRHKSLDVVFEHSWGLLDNQEKEVLAKTAIFQGGFDSRAAEAVIGTSFADLAMLCEKSLLRVDDNGRYSLHEVIRQNAVGKLMDSSKVHSVAKAAHQKYYMDFIDTCDYFELSDNLENIEAAWLVSIENYQNNPHNTDISVKFREIYTSQGMPKRAISILDKSLKLIQDKQYKRDIKLLKADLMRTMAHFLDQLGFHEEALDYDQKVLTIAKEVNELKLLTNAFHKLAYSYERSGRLIKANNLLEKSLENSDHLGQTALLLAELARVKGKMGNFHDAENNYKQSITLTEKLGNIQEILHRKNNYSKLLLDIGRYEEAKVLINETLILSEKNNIIRFQHYLYKKQAQICLEQRNYTDAWTIAQKAFSMCNEQGDISALPSIIALLGDIAFATSKIPIAKKYYAEVLALTKQVNDSDGKYTTLIGLAKIHVLYEENSKAVTLLSSLILQSDLRSSLKITVSNELEKLKNALSEVDYFKAFQEGTVDFLEQYCLEF